MNKFLIKIPYQTIKSIASKVFPEYRGRKGYISIHDSGSMELQGTYWDGGSRSYYAAVNLETGESGHLRGTEVHPDRNKVEGLEIPLSRNMCVFEHAYRGTTQWINVHIHPDSLKTTLFNQLTLNDVSIQSTE